MKNFINNYQQPSSLLRKLFWISSCRDAVNPQEFPGLDRSDSPITNAICLSYFDECMYSSWNAVHSQETLANYERSFAILITTRQTSSMEKLIIHPIPSITMTTTATTFFISWIFCGFEDHPPKSSNTIIIIHTLTLDLGFLVMLNPGPRFQYFSTTNGI